MRFRNKLFLLVLPIIIVPTAVTTLLSTTNTQRSFEALEYEMLEVKLDLAINRAEEAMQTLENAGIEEIGFYLRQQQQRVTEFLESADIPGGFMFVLRSNGEVAYHPQLRSTTRTMVHPDPVLTKAVSDSQRGRVRYTVAAYGTTIDPRIAVYRRFDPWDWTFVATVDEKIVVEAIDRLRMESGLAAGITIALTMVLLLLLSRSVARPVRMLMDATRRVGDGDLTARVGALGKGEFGDLSTFFDGMIGKLEEYAEELETMVAERTGQLQDANAQLSKRNEDLVDANAVIESKNQHIRQSISIARRIQHSMLPPLDQLRRQFGEIFVVYLPKDELSGDFYWSAEIETGRILCLADCMGHGVPGGLITTIAISHLQRIIHDDGVSDPGEILTRLHDRLMSSREELGGIDMIIVHLPGHRSSRDPIRYACAHRPLFLADKDGIRIERGNRFAVGSERTPEGHSFDSATLNSDFEGMCYLVSDGLGDQPDASGKRFGTVGITDLLGELHTATMATQRANVLECVSKLDSMQRDDITIIGMRLEQT